MCPHRFHVDKVVVLALRPLRAIPPTISTDLFLYTYIIFW